MDDCDIRGKVFAAIREGIGRHIHDSHDERAPAEFQGTCAEIPGEDGTHMAILNDERWHSAESGEKRFEC